VAHDPDPLDPLQAVAPLRSAPGSPSWDGGDGEPADHEWIRHAQRGEEAAFEGLVKRHEERAVRVALALVGNREDARDIAQDAFLRVFRNLDGFDFQHEFTTWLYRIVTNLAIDFLRRRRPATSTTGVDEEDADLDLADADAPRAHDALEGRETSERVRAAIDRLAPHFRSVLILRELEGLPCTEIARIVDATHVTVRWRLHRGRKLFQEEWERLERASANEPPRPPVDPTPDAPRSGTHR
jgi:RNA polymerase sigma-70 factor (ECF subfamily)